MAVLPAFEAPPSTSAGMSRPAAVAAPFDSLLLQAATAVTPAATPAAVAVSEALPPAPAGLPLPVATPAVATKPVARPVPALRPGELVVTELPAADASLPVPSAVLLAATPPELAAAPVETPSLSPPEALLGWIAAMRQINLPRVEPSVEAAWLPALTTAATAVSATSTVGTDAATTVATLPGPSSIALATASHETLTVATPPAASAPSFTLPVVALASAPVAPPVFEPPPLSPIPLPMDSPDWPQKLGEQIQWHLGVGIQEARIEINPRDLGVVDVRLSVDDSGLRVHLSAAHAQTRELLQNDLPRLREALQEGGVLLADAQVGREAPSREQSRQPDPDTAAATDGDRAGSTSQPATSWRRRNGLLDDYA